MADPAVTVDPVITGSTVVGQSLACSRGSWTNDPTIFEFQWTQAAVEAGPFSDISGATSATLRLLAAQAGKWIGCDVMAFNDVPVPTPGTPWLGWTVPAVPGGATVISTYTDLLDALNNPADDTVYDATGISHTFPDETLTGRCLDGHEATFFLGSNVIFGGGTLLTGGAVELKGMQNVTLYGGKVTNPTKGYGIVVRGSSGVPCKNVTWWDFLIHDVAMTGLFMHQNSGDVQGFDFRGVIERWCLVPSLDPHVTKGSGLHASYDGVTSSGGSVHDGQLVLHVHDGTYGGGVQLGPRLTNVDVQVQGERLMYDPPAGADGTGGNVVQIFGDSQSNLVVSYAVGDTVRRVVETSGLGTPANQIHVNYGRATNNRVSPAYATNGHVTYTDCS